MVRYLVLEEMLPVSEASVTALFDVEGRKIECSYTGDGSRVTVNMGSASWRPAEIPITSSNELLQGTLQGVEGKWSAASMGNPHCMTFVDSLDQIDVRKLGPRLEHHAHFPNRTNVEWVYIERPDRLHVKVWERGAGATPACGTAACAVVATAARLGMCNSDATVVMPGGELEISLSKGDGMVYLTGPAAEVCEGQLSPGFVERCKLKR